MLQNRRFERITLATPIDATAGTLRVSLIDVSQSGLKVHHQEALAPKGEAFPLHFLWNGSIVRLRCTVMWTTIHRLARSTSERPTLSSGLRIESFEGSAERIFLSMLDALRAPAETSPYLFCELVNGAWRQRRTTKRDQPGEGFTVAASEDAAHVERLCSAYATGDGETRKLIRTLAALSIKSQGEEVTV